MKTPATVNICLVEDNPLDVSMISEMLLQAGRGELTLSVVYDRLEDAMNMLRESREIDLVLLDLALVDSDRIETFRSLSQVASHLPVVVLSGYDDEALATQTVREGAQDYLVKTDLTARLLTRSIMYAMERKRSELELKFIREDLERRVTERTLEWQETNQRLELALAELNNAQGRMIQQERLHALERMASGIAHDFNNTLSPVLAHTEWLLMKPEVLRNEEKLRQTLVKIYDSATRCVEIVSRLREFSRSRDEVAQFGPIDLRHIIQEAVSITQPCWRGQAQARGCSISVETDFTPLPKIIGAKVELREMLMNLMLNAIDAIPGNGTIRLSTFMDEGRPSLRISDNGTGMTEEVGEHCMEPFFTTKQGMGSGLGLGVVYGIAQRHDAEIAIQSKMDEGTDITIRFPVHIAKDGEEEGIIAAAGTLYGLRILVAEDEPLVRKVLEGYLKEDLHKVVVAADGAEAILRLEEGEFDLLITDQSMPRMSGERVAKCAREMNSKIRVLLLTGLGEMFPQTGYESSVVDVWMQKPFTFETLREGISKAMASRN